MRKFLLRWWYTPDWPREQYERMIRDWNGDWTPVRKAMLATIPAEWNRCRGEETRIDCEWSNASGDCPCKGFRESE